MIACMFHDGSVEYRDRTTFEETMSEVNFENIMHPMQAGLSYTDDEPCKLVESVLIDF